MKGKNGIGRVAFIGNYVPRQCGIATFTTDLCEHFARRFPEATCFSLPVNDRPDGYDYPERVWFELEQDDLNSYRQAADYLNVNDVDVVCLQHEFGIFGGPAGKHILALLRELRMPVVTTLHTVLQEPSPEERAVMDELRELSDRFVVMSERGRQFLENIYDIPAGRIDLIHHGIPDVPFIDPNFYKDKFGVEGNIVLLTFGLLSPNKGIEYVIRALPEVLDRYPKVVYIVLGATHPNVKRQQGETYRLGLQRLADQLGVANHVMFHNQFVSLEKLVEFIGAADIYVTPYLNEAQITSGTLAYTVGAGKPVISTPYWYAEELLADGRGIIVPFRDERAIARAILELLDDEPRRHAIRKRAYMLGRKMIWPEVTRQYMVSFQKAKAARWSLRRAAFTARTVGTRPLELPAVRLDHLRRLTDDTGIIQHCTWTVPNRLEGYCTDDNARALLAAVLLEQVGGGRWPEARDLATRYLAFLWDAFNPRRGRFRNFMNYRRQWLEEVGSEDAHGRAIWALGTVANRSRHSGLRGPASQLFAMAAPACAELTSPRAWAFSLLGIHEYLQRYAGDRPTQMLRDKLVERLVELYRRNSSSDWCWFEDVVTYSNAKLPHALLVSGHDMGDNEVTQIGMRSLSWLAAVQSLEGGHFVPIGNDGFYRRGGRRARFDQQPIEAHAMVSACLEAYRLTGDRHWYQEAHRAFDWFLGRNDCGLPLYDPSTGGCRDGLHSDRVNENQGAESTLAFLLALLEMQLVETHLDTTRRHVGVTTVSLGRTAAERAASRAHAFHPSSDGRPKRSTVPAGS